MQWTAKLSVLDQRKPIMHQSILFCFPSQDPDKTAAALIRGIEKTTTQFPYLAGRIFQGEDQGFTCISWEDGGLVHVEKNDGEGLPSYAELRAEGMPLHNLSRDLRPAGACANSRPDLESVPGFLASYTVLDGGVILCLAFHHHLVDGLGICDILVVIADNTASRVPTSQHDHRAILRRYEDVNKALGFEKSDEAAHSTSGQMPLNGTSQPGKPAADLSLVPKMFTFSVQALNELRKTFATQFGGKRPSLVVLISCLLWMAISDARLKHQPAEANNAESETSTLLLAVNFRTAFSRDSYFNSDDFVGNLSDGAPVTKPIDDLRIPSIHSNRTNTLIANSLARPIADLVESFTSAATPASIQTSYRKTFDIPDARVLRGSLSLPPNLVTLTSYASFDFSFDFGPEVGKMEFGRVATVAGEGIDGTVVLLPRNREQTGADEVIEAFLKLKNEDMAWLEKHDWLTPFFAKAPF